MRIPPPNGSSWTHSALSTVQMSSVEMFYFTDECSECKHDTLLTLELEQGDIRFRCPHCDAEVDHDVVVACDRKYLRDQGWFVKET